MRRTLCHGVSSSCPILFTTNSAQRRVLTIGTQRNSLLLSHLWIPRNWTTVDYITRGTPLRTVPLEHNWVHYHLQSLHATVCRWVHYHLQSLHATVCRWVHYHLQSLHATVCRWVHYHLQSLHATVCRWVHCHLQSLHATVCRWVHYHLQSLHAAVCRWILNNPKYLAAEMLLDARTPGCKKVNLCLNV